MHFTFYFVGDLRSPARSTGPADASETECLEKEVHCVPSSQAGEARGLHPSG